MGVDGINGKERMMGIRKERAEKWGRWDKWVRKDEGDEKGKGLRRGVDGINARGIRIKALIVDKLIIHHIIRL